MKKEDLEIVCYRQAIVGLGPVRVRVTHLPSGIASECTDVSPHNAKVYAIGYLEPLVEAWEAGE